MRLVREAEAEAQRLVAEASAIVRVSEQNEALALASLSGSTRAERKRLRYVSALVGSSYVAQAKAEVKAARLIAQAKAELLSAHAAERRFLGSAQAPASNWNTAAQR